MHFVPVHDVCQRLGDRVLTALSAFHALTGCDSNSSISGIGKKKAWKAMIRSQVNEGNLGLLRQEEQEDEETLRKWEAFICNIYQTSKKRPQTNIRHISEELSWWLARNPFPVGHGWIIEDGERKPHLMTKDSLPSSLLELTTCTCKMSECRNSCSFANFGLSCNEVCNCMAEETCCNPHGIQWEEYDVSDSDCDD